MLGQWPDLHRFVQCDDCHNVETRIAGVEEFTTESSDDDQFYYYYYYQREILKHEVQFSPI